MQMELLLTLADGELPSEFLDPEVRSSLQDLHDGGHILCSFPPPVDGNSQPVCVHMVTPLGYKTLRHFGPKWSWRRTGDSVY